MNNKGFTLVEVLATIAILAILFGVSVPVVSKYINKAKVESDEEMTETVKKATVSYIQANKDLAPKEDGSSVEVYVTELYQNKYITHELINSNSESCMDGSYTQVTKVEEGKYKYDVYLFCGGKEIKNEVKSSKPEIGNFKFSDLDDLDKMSFSYSLFIDNKDEYIEEYSYIIYAKMSKDSDYDEVYDSGPISGNHLSTIGNTVRIKDKVSFINTNDIKVTINVKSNTGISNTKTITSK